MYGTVKVLLRPWDVTTPPPGRRRHGSQPGLGFLLAREFAERGHDLVVCARSADGLDPAAQDPQGLVAGVLPDRVKAAMHGFMAKPGSGEE